MINASCSTCHNTGSFPYFKSGADGDGDGLISLAKTNVCEVCHQDGSGNPASNEYKDGWSAPDFVLDSDSCHDIAPNSGSHAVHTGALSGGYPVPVVYGNLRITKDYSPNQPSSVNLLRCGNCHPLDSPFHGNQVWGDVEPLLDSTTSVGISTDLLTWSLIQ